MTDDTTLDYATDPRTQELVDRLFAHQRRSVRLTAFLRVDSGRRYVVEQCRRLYCCRLQDCDCVLSESDDGNTCWHPTIEAAIDVALGVWETALARRGVR